MPRGAACDFEVINPGRATGLVSMPINVELTAPIGHGQRTTDAICRTDDTARRRRSLRSQSDSLSRVESSDVAAQPGAGQGARTTRRSSIASSSGRRGVRSAKAFASRSVRCISADSPRRCCPHARRTWREAARCLLRHDGPVRSPACSGETGDREPRDPTLRGSIR